MGGIPLIPHDARPAAARGAGPLQDLQGELFKTFRQRRCIVSVEEYDCDKRALARMLHDFRADYLAHHKVHGRSRHSSDARGRHVGMPGGQVMPVNAPSSRGLACACDSIGL